MVAQPEFGCPAELCNDIPRDDAGRRPVQPRCQIWIGEGNPSLFGRHTGDRPPGYLRCDPLKEDRE